MISTGQKKLAKYHLLVSPRQELFRWKVDAYPALIYAVCYGMTKSPYGWPKSEGFFIGHDFYWYSNWADIWEHGNNYIDKYLSRSRGVLPEKILRKYQAAFRALQQQVAVAKRIDYHQLDNIDLRRQWFKFFKGYSKFWLIVTDIEVLSYGASHRLEQLIKKRQLLISAEEVSQLTAFPQRSYVLEEEYELIKIARLKSAIRRKNALSRHTKKFNWIRNGYHGVRPAGNDFFVGRMKKLLADRKLDGYFRHLENYYLETKRNFTAIARKYKLDSEIIKYARLAQQSSFIQDRRKALSWQATSHIVRLYEALAKRMGISLEQSLHLLYDEFDYALKTDRRKLLTEIKKREQACRLRIWADRTTISTVGTKKLFNIFEKEYAQISTGAIKGMVAYPGKVSGRVQVILNGGQLDTFQPGRILVALMTSPDYISAMRQAKAIVTDDGGLTCHAAIVARELKKPCIVGTRFATKVLHNTDWVEVDAKEGTVKILKK